MLTEIVAITVVQSINAFKGQSKVGVGMQYYV